MAFQKGVSGNPAGRPKKTPEQIAFEIKCRGYATDKGFKKLEAWAEGENPAASIAALNVINGYGFGKPVETSIIDANVTTQTGSTASEIAGELAEIIGEPKAEGVGNDSPAKVDPGA